MTEVSHSRDASRLSWTNFRDIYLNAGEPARIPILDQPITEITFDPRRGEIRLTVGSTENESLPRRMPRFVLARHVLIDGRRYLEVTTDRPNLYRPFYFLILAIADHLSAGTSPVQSFSAALAENRELLQAETLLSDDALTGLYGELWVLRELIRNHGPRAVSAWTGAHKIPHDFRFGQIELEVKTTRTAVRQHRIHGATQLSPSPGCQLYLISIQAEPTGPGSGNSVPELETDIAALLATSIEERAKFRELLSGCNYFDRDVDSYGLRLTLRNSPMLIPVDRDFPAITQDKVTALLGAAHASRILQIEYSVNVEGLGEAYDTAESISVLKSGF